MIELLRHIGRIVFFVTVQGLVLNRMDLWQGYILPSLYIYSILMLPITTPRVVLLLASFATGMLMDLFTNTGGLHISACLLVGFFQPIVLRILSPREGYETGQRQTIMNFGWGWFLAYAGSLTFVHHLWLFFMEQMRFTPFFSTLGKVLLSAAATVVLMIISQYLGYTGKDRIST